MGGREFRRRSQCSVEARESRREEVRNFDTTDQDVIYDYSRWTWPPMLRTEMFEES